MAILVLLKKWHKQTDRIANYIINSKIIKSSVTVTTYQNWLLKMWQKVTGLAILEGL